MKKNLLTSLSKTCFWLKKPMSKNQFTPPKTCLSFVDFKQKFIQGIINGVNDMIPFVILGSFGLALSYLIDINTAVATLGTNSETSKWFNAFAKLIFSFLVPVLSADVCARVLGMFGLLPGLAVGLIADGRFVFHLDINNGVFSFTKFPAANNISSFFGVFFGDLICCFMIIFFANYLFAKLPKSWEGIKTTLLIPIIPTFCAIVLFWLVNITLVFLNYGLHLFLVWFAKQNLLPLLCLISGIMIAFDLSGPTYKAVYFFALTTQAPSILTSVVMVASMVPPLAIALAVVLLPSYYSSRQKVAGYSCFLYGLSAIGESALPFIIKKPKIIIPANILGAGICSLLVGVFQIQTPTFFGGVLAFPFLKSNLLTQTNSQIVGGILLLLLALVIGVFFNLITIILSTQPRYFQTI